MSARVQLKKNKNKSNRNFLVKISDLDNLKKGSICCLFWLNCSITLPKRTPDIFFSFLLSSCCCWKILWFILLFELLVFWLLLHKYHHPQSWIISNCILYERWQQSKYSLFFIRQLLNTFRKILTKYCHISGGRCWPTKRKNDIKWPTHSLTRQNPSTSFKVN